MDQYTSILKLVRPIEAGYSVNQLLDFPSAQGFLCIPRNVARRYELHAQ